jgi:hypothetical protein
MGKIRGMEGKLMSQSQTKPSMPPVAALHDVRTILANWLTDLQRGLSARGLEEETGHRYPEAASISGNTVQGCLVDINRLTVKIQQIFVEHPELQKEFAIAA